jgi:hypothetical protein
MVTTLGAAGGVAIAIGGLLSALFISFHCASSSLSTGFAAAGIDGLTAG